MALNEQTCNTDRIADYLDDRLTGPGLVEFQDHLAVCEHCRIRLQDSAAEPEVWGEVAELLWPIVETACDSEDRQVQQRKPSKPIRRLLETLAPTDDPEMLGRIGDYEVSGVVGVGGMGAVLKGFDTSLRRVVAIKVMDPHLADNGLARTRFQREARAAAAITHDNVIDIYVVSEANGLPYLVMPFARGPSLQKRIDDRGPLGVVEIVRIGHQIADGLAAAHEQGVVHRDIKPANILLNEGIERLWITDFGVARAMCDVSMTQTGLVAGTPQYMSPEQARGESVDHRSDLFSLGCVLYTACTGRPPFRAESPYAMIRRIADTEPTPVRELNPDVPDWLCSVIAKLMSKDPQERFQNAREVADLFEACLAHLQQPTKIEFPNVAMLLPQTGRTSQPVFVHRATLAIGSVVLMLTIGTALFQFSGPQGPPNKAESAQVAGATEFTSIRVPMSGRIIRWGETIADNGHVQKGDLIVEFSAADPQLLEKLKMQAAAAADETGAAGEMVEAFEKKLEYAKLTAEAMKSKLKAAETVHSDVTEAEDALVESARERVAFEESERARWQDALENAIVELDRLNRSDEKENLLEQRTMASRQRAKAEYGVRSAPERTEKAKEELASRISEQKTKLSRVQLDLETAKAEQSLANDAVAAVEVELAGARLQLARSRSIEFQLKARLAESPVLRITAPMDGIVRSKAIATAHSAGNTICEIWSVPLPHRKDDDRSRNLTGADDVPNVSGKWSDAVWGAVHLDLVNSDRNQYVGTWTTSNDRTYQIQMAWFDREKQFVGTWSSVDQHFGRLVLTVKESALDGAFTTDEQPPGEKQPFPRLFALQLIKSTDLDAPEREVKR